MKRIALFVLAACATIAGADPLRYSTAPGDHDSWSAHFSRETIVRRGGAVERFLWTRAGMQRATACATENGRTLFAVETDHGPARVSVYTVDGQDRSKAEAERLSRMLPAPSKEVSFLWLDDRGRGAPEPRDPSLEEAVLRALDEVEVFPEGDESSWTREGRSGTVGWKADFARTGGTVKGTFAFKAADLGGARVAFDAASATLSMLGGAVRSIEGKASWTVATKDGTERTEIKFSLTGSRGTAMTAAEAADSAADAAPLISAQEAWRDGERDRAVELWEKAAADPANRWAAFARGRAVDARRDFPMLGQSAPALKATAWIGAAPEAGHWQLVYFWATWAPRCEPELAGLSALLKDRTRVAGAAVTRADALQSEDAIRSAASRLSLPFGVALDDGSLTKGFKVEALPRAFLVDPEGRVRFEGMGSEVETLRTVLDKLAGE